MPPPRPCTPILALAAALTALAPAAVAQTTSARPNVLFIALDDLNTRIGPYGDTAAITPRMDQLASTGLTFLNHHVQWAVCGPSRAALTTSLTPEETNVMGFKKIRDKNFLPDVVTLPQHFRAQGYETACAGKFHDNRTVGTPTDISTTYPDGVMDDGKTVDDPASWSLPYASGGSGFSTPTKVAVDSTDQADSLYEDAKILGAGLSLLADLATPGGAAPGDKPFFLAVGFKKPHLPFVAPKKYWDLYTRSALSLPAFQSVPAGATTYNANTLLSNSELAGGGDDTTNGYLPYTTDATLLQNAGNQRELLHGYYACISFVDTLVGQLLDTLAATDDPRQPGKKLSETTIVVLWGDHGLHLGEHGHWAKHTAMDAATAAPLIIRDPRRPRNSSNSRTARPVGTADIFPTLCELAGLPIPTQPLSASVATGRPLRGRSLVPLFDDPSARVHHGAISQFNTGGQYGYAYRTERFRYIEWINFTGNMNDGNARRDLYDLAADPLATRNVVNDEAYAGVVWQLSRALRAETTTRGAVRLNNAAPIATGGTAWLPDTSIRSSTTPGSVLLAWLPAAGVAQDIVFSDNLSTWTTLTSVYGDRATIPLVGSRAFFRVRPGSARPPLFASDPLLRSAASADAAYSATLAGAATDADAGSLITYAKVSGPAWLQVAPGGALSGTPSSTDLGANYFSVSATDQTGFSTLARLQITVGASAPPPPPTTTSTFAVGEDAYAHLGSPTTVTGNRTRLEVRSTASATSARLAYLKFTVSGVGQVVSAVLRVRATDFSPTSPAESDPVRAHAVADTSWTEAALTWNTRPALGSLLATDSGPDADGWYVFDVTAQVAGNGVLSFALDEQGNTLGSFAARENGADTAARLEVTWR